MINLDIWLRFPGIVLKVHPGLFVDVSPTNGVNPLEIHEKPTRFLRILYQQKQCQLRLKKAVGS